MASADDNKLIKIMVKTPQHKEIIEINENAKIEEVKCVIAYFCSRIFLILYVDVCLDYLLKALAIVGFLFIFTHLNSIKI